MPGGKINSGEGGGGGLRDCMIAGGKRGAVERESGKMPILRLKPGPEEILAAEGLGEALGRGRGCVAEMGCKGRGEVAGAGVAIAADEGVGGGFGRDEADGNEEIEQGFEELGEGDSVFAGEAVAHPV